ncbi:hypothetical protein BDF20DRAFT_836473 [Mycotypha africana]|uniref:uncharacterized protein n=1 Tax=Mycotypha africana TaxID=64632 RepID=UPI002301729C|nr:uncharacterized protein BDF20DRAFT_836473 [Mycotypha africana]KAI8975033.1 hypothetical protein BDF20DRAFT_836473 [Mycotypha africana]
MTSSLEQQRPVWPQHHQQHQPAQQQLTHSQSDVSLPVNSLSSLSPHQDQLMPATPMNTDTSTSNTGSDPSKGTQHTSQSEQQQQAPVRKRTRATADQLSVLEDTFAVNVSPNSKLRKQLAEQLNMSERSIQIWFQNRRAKVKHMQKRAQMQMHQATLRAQLYHHQQQQQYSNYYTNEYYHSYPPPHHFPPFHQQHHYLYPYQYQHGRNVTVPHQQPIASNTIPVSRAQSVDVIAHKHPHQQRPYHPPIYPHPTSGPHSINATSTSHLPSQQLIAPAMFVHQRSQQLAWQSNPVSNISLTRQSMPPQIYDIAMNLDFPDYIGTPTPPPRTHSVTSAPIITNDPNIPTLISVPDAGPTAMLTSTLKQSSMPPLSVEEDTNSEKFTSSVLKSSSSPEIIRMEQLPTIDPSTLLMKAAISGEETTQQLTESTTAEVKTNDTVEDIHHNERHTHHSNEEPASEPASCHTIENEKPDSNISGEIHLAKNQQEQTLNTIVTSNGPEEEPKDLYLSATTLTVGTWHRLKSVLQNLDSASTTSIIPTADLVCVYCPDKKLFAWHVIDSGCHFKMEISQEAISSIEFIALSHQQQQSPSIAQIHFDISEPPLFYMESSIQQQQQQQQPKRLDLSQQRKAKKKKMNTTGADEQSEAASSDEPTATSTTITTPVWVQCSDFTEGKQASRYFRHTIQGDAYCLKREIMALINNHEETRRFVHFTDPIASSSSIPSIHAVPLNYMYSQQQQQQQPLIVDAHQRSEFYLSNTPFYNDSMLLPSNNSTISDFPSGIVDLTTNTSNPSLSNNNSDATLTYWTDANINSTCDLFMD